MVDDKDFFDRAPRREVQKTITRAFDAQQVLTEQTESDDLSQEFIRHLASLAKRYKSQLAIKRDEAVIDPPWEERQIHWLDEYLGETVTKTVKLPRRNGARRHVEQPAIYTVPPQQWDALFEELHAIADDLGVTYGVREQEADPAEV